MAKAFNLTAQLNIQGPNNLKPVIGKIKSAISSIKTDIKLNIDTSSAKNISAITRQLNALAKASDKANSSVSSLSGTLANLASGFNNAAGSVASSVGALNQVQKSVKSSGTAIVQTTSAIEDFGKVSGLAVRRFAAFSTVTGVIYGLTNAITTGAKEFLVFNKEVVRLSQVTGQSVKDLKGVTDEITRLATNFGVASSDLLAVSSTLAQAGLSASDTRIALEALAKSALAPSFDNITDTTEGAIAAMRQFGIQAGELEGALGSINSVAAAFAVESSDIITAIQRTGGVFAASSKGVSEGTDALNEFIAVFTSIRATTRESAETIATGLRTIFTRIQRGKTIEALKEYGVVLTDLQGKFVGPYEATRRLSEGLSKLDPRDLRFGQIVEELGGFRQIGKVIPLIQQFATAEQALGVAQKGQTSLAKDASIAQQALAVQFTKTRESFLALIRDIGDSTSFKVFTTLALTLANAFISLAGALKPLLPLLLTVASLKIGSALTQFGTGFLSGIGGGKRKGFARGGLVPGSGNSDTVPAMLTPGEFVMRKSAVEALGSGNLNRMNKYADGGYVKKKLPGAEQALKKQAITYDDISNLKINNAGKGAIRGYMFENYVGTEYGTKSPDQTFPDITNLKGFKKKFGLTKQETGKDIIAAELKYRSGLEPTFTEKYNPDNTAVLYAINKNSGGLIQKFLNGGGVKDIASTQGKDIEEVILGFVKTLGGIGGVKGYLGVAKNDREFDSLFRKGNISKNLERTTDLIDKARKAAEDKGTQKAAAMAKAQQLAIVGLNPLDYSDTLFEKISNTDSTIHVKGLLGQYADEAAYMQQSMGNLVASGARRFQSKAIFGGNKNLAFDFDDTLVSGADIYKPGTNQIDISGYSDLNRVQEALNGPNVGLTELGQALKSILQSNPDILNQIRILTARPQSNAPLLAAKLQELGLNIPASKITGVSGSRNKVANLGQNEKLIDDFYATVEAVRKAGGEAYPYAPIKGLNQQEQYAANLAAAEGSALQAILVALGATGGSIQNEDVDFKSGLGPQAASFFGIDPNFPTEVKRTLSPDTIYKAKKEFSNWFATKGMAKGGSVEDTVPAMLTPGEFVINKQSAQRIGYGNLHRMNKAKGFNKGGAVGGVQYFKEGGEAENTSILQALNTTQLVTAISTVLIPQITTLASTFGEINNSALKGFINSIESASTAGFSASVSMETLGKNISQNKKRLLIGGVTAASAIGGGLQGFASQILQNSIDANAKSLNAFNKALEDVKNAVDEEAKTRATKDLEKAFQSLTEIISNNTPYIQAGEVISTIGESFSRIGQTALTVSTTLLALRSSLKSTATSLAGKGLAKTVGGFLAKQGAKAAGSLSGGTAAPAILTVLTLFDIASTAISLFSNNTKKASEQLKIFSDATRQQAMFAQENQLNNPRYIERLATIRDIKSSGLSTEQQQLNIASNLQTNIPLQTAIKSLLKLSANIDIMTYRQTIQNRPEELAKFNEAQQTATAALIQTAFEQFIQENPQSNEGQRFKGSTELFSNPLTWRMFGGAFTQQEIETVGKTQLGKNIMMDTSADILAAFETRPLRTEMFKLKDITDRLAASISKLGSDAEMASSKLEDDLDLALGKAKFTVNPNLQKTIDILSNPKANSTEEFKTAIDNTLISLRSSQTGTIPAVETVLSNMREQLTALQVIEQRAATTFDIFNQNPEIAQRSNENLFKVFEDMIAKTGEVSPSVAKSVSKALAERVTAATEAGKPISAQDIFDKEREDIVAGAESVQKALIDVTKARIETEKRFAEQMNKALDLLSQSRQNLEKRATVRADFDLRMQRLFGRGEPTLNQLNRPFQQRLAVYSPQTSNAGEINARIATAQRNIERINTQRQTAGVLTDETTKKLNNELLKEQDTLKSLITAQDMLVNNTETLGNAFDKLSQRQEELFKTGQNALDIFTTALDPIEFQRKVEAPFNALMRLEAGVGTRSQKLRDIAAVRGGVDILAINDEQTKAINDLLYRTLSQITGQDMSKFTTAGMEQDPIIQKYRKEAEIVKDNILIALEGQGKLVKEGFNILVTSSEDIRVTFEKGLRNSLLGIVQDIEKIRSDILQKTSTQNFGQLTPEQIIRNTEESKLREQIRSKLGGGLTENFTRDEAILALQSKKLGDDRRGLWQNRGIFRDRLNLNGYERSRATKRNIEINDLINQLFNPRGKMPYTEFPENSKQRQMQQDAESKFYGPFGPQRYSPSNNDSGQLRQSMDQLSAALVKVETSISNIPSMDAAAVQQFQTASSNLNSAVTSLEKTKLKIDYAVDVTQNIDVVGDVQLSPETIASIQGDVRKQIENSIAIYNKSIQTFG